MLGCLPCIIPIWSHISDFGMSMYCTFNLGGNMLKATATLSSTIFALWPFDSPEWQSVLLMQHSVLFSWKRELDILCVQLEKSQKKTKKGHHLAIPVCPRMLCFLPNVIMMSQFPADKLVLWNPILVKQVFYYKIINFSQIFCSLLESMCNRTLLKSVWYTKLHFKRVIKFVLCLLGHLDV